MSSVNTGKSASRASAIAHSFIGLNCLAFVYGLYGILLTLFHFLRVGSKRFLKRVDRPTPPDKATNPIFGVHNVIKLKSSGIYLHYVSKGVPNQPMILFVHGFPECWYSWRNQMKYFAKDYRVVAIDQRGYGLSSKPPFVSDYRVEVLAGDVADVIEQLGYESCILAGHDLGGFVAWTTAILYPHLVERLIVMNSPHPMAFRQELTLAQVRKSWHMFFFQVPFLPELLYEADDFTSLHRLFQRKSSGLVNTELISDNDIEVYKYTLSQKGSMKAAINYYRAFFRYHCDFSRAEITAPVLLLWGCQDRQMGEEFADASQKYCTDIRIQKVPNASHWINQDVPDVVNKYIDVFLKENPVMDHSIDF